MKIWIGRVLLVATIPALALAALHVAAPSRASSARGSRLCGGDRWHVRTLQDRPKLLPPRTTTLAKLERIPRPKSITATRMPIERQVVTLDTGAAAVLRETNGDIRVFLYGPSSTVKPLFAFAPHPFCNGGATGSRRKQMGIARQQIIKAADASCGHALVTGVLFFSTKPKTLRERRVQLRPILGFEPQC
jgi:hypothetical protein